MSSYFGRARSLAVIPALSALLSVPVVAQIPTTDSVRVVVVKELSPTLAGVLEGFIPTAGYLYARDWKRGIPLGIVRVAGQAMVLADDTPSTNPIYENGCGTTCTIGGFLYLAATIYAIYDAVRVTKAENARRLADVTTASLAPRFDRTGVGFGLSVRPRW